ncbi:MAG TPA: DUF998 domain-containing protein [Candidatus Margulisiibacteriota bacterium]|nr:DUF998 domain-containing protein [Candidatus Margulisiibacteriota bacterium]
MIKPTLPTRVLLACGVVGGPLYVMVTLARALTRDGFDMRQHRFTLLTAGDLGWLQQANMVLVGLLVMLFALGVSQVLRTGRGAVWTPRLLGLFGLAYIVGGVLTSDPVVGFPPGTMPCEPSRSIASRAITVRVSQVRLRKLMRVRRVATQSELVNARLAEEEERLRSHVVLRATARTVRAADVDARLL